MKQESYKLFENATIQEIVSTVSQELEKRNESPFWVEKVAPFTEAILSILIPLRDNNLLFDPQGKPQTLLTPELFLEWSDFVSLKGLAFKIQASNAQKKLIGTQIDEESCKKYREIDLTLLGKYLAKYSVNLENEFLDFPIANYNLHQGVSNVIKSLL